MTLRTILSTFASNESGAVTVDFVVLCAAAAALAVGVGGTIASQIGDSAEKLGAVIDSNVEAADESSD